MHTVGSISLAHDEERRCHLHLSLRERMLNSPRGVMVRKRGQLYWNQIERWSAEPMARPYIKKRLAEIGKDIRDVYGLKAKKTIVELEERDRQAKELETRSDESVEDSRKLAL